MEENIITELEGVEKKEAPQRSYNFSNIGTTGLKRYGGTIYEEFLPALLMPNCLKVYKEMSYNDATIGAILFIFEMMIRKTPWNVIPAGSKRIDKQLATFVEENKEDMSHSWDDMIIEAMSCFRYGWAWLETVYKKRSGYSRDPDFSSKYSDGKVGWSKNAGRSQDTWSAWIFDDANDKPDKLLAMEQIAPTVSKAIKIPWDKSLLFRTTGERGNPEGKSLLRNAYRPWYFKKHIEEIEGIGIERELAGLPVLTVPEGIDIWNPNNDEAVALKSNLEKMVSNIRRDKNEGVLLPFGYELNLLSSSGSGTKTNTTQIINRYDQRIAVSMLADLLMMGAERTGSFAMANVKKTMLAVALEAQAKNIANVINKYAIPRLIRLNTFTGYTDFPKIMPGEIEVPDMVQFADALTKLSGLGFNFLDEKVASYIYSCMGLPRPEDKTKMIDEKNITTNSMNNEVNTQDTGLTPRQSAPKQTDSKTEFNQVYESAGMKKGEE